MKEKNSNYIKVRVIPGSKREKAVKLGFSCYEICVREPAERNLANLRVKSILQQLTRVPGKRVGFRLVKGARSKSKIYQLIDQ